MYTLDKLRMAILSVSLVDFCVCAHTPVLLVPDQDAEDSCCPGVHSCILHREKPLH